MDVQLYPIPRHIGMVISSQRASFLTAKTGLLPLLLPPLLTALPRTEGTLALDPDVNPSIEQTVQQESVNITPIHITPIAMIASIR